MVLCAAQTSNSPKSIYDCKAKKNNHGLADLLYSLPGTKSTRVVIYNENESLEVFAGHKGFILSVHVSV